MRTLCCHTKKVIRIQDGNVCGNPSCSNYLGKAELIRKYDSAKIIFAFIVFFFFLVFTLEDFSMNGEKRAMMVKKTPLKNVVPLTIYNIQRELEKQEIICADAVLAQMRLESGNFTSTLLKRTNNMLGMRYPMSRETKACGIYLPETDTIIYGHQDELKKFTKSDNYSVYQDWQDAIADYKLWQRNAFKLDERYLNFLGNYYAEDSLYVRKIRQLVID